MLDVDREMNYARWISVVVVAFILIGCGERPPSYESRFRDSVSIHFSPGSSYIDVEQLRGRVDELLRSRKIGIWSGAMRSDEATDIDHISLDLDFDLVDEAKLVQSFIDEGMIPKDVEIEYYRNKANSDANSE